MLEFNLDNTEKLISAAAGIIAILGGFGLWKKHSSAAKSPIPVETGPVTNTQNSSQVINFNVANPEQNNQPNSELKSMQNLTIPELKKITNILFIDDDKGFKIVSVLKKMGWEHTKLVADINSLEQQSLLDAQVIFVDIQGVGKAMHYEDEGLGLAQAIKRRHPDKKVIIYSAQEHGARFHEALREADYCLPKTAEPIRFEDTIVRVLAK